MKKLLKLLGLAEDASEDSAVAAVQTIQNRATQAETSVTTLTKDRDELLTAQVESDLDKHAGVIANRDAVKAQLIANRKGTLAVLEGLKKADETEGDDKGGKRITNRAAAKTPEQIATATAEKKAEERAARISNRARAIRTEAPKTTLADAYATAQAEVDAEAK